VAKGPQKKILRGRALGEQKLTGLRVGRGVGKVRGGVDRLGANNVGEDEKGNRPGQKKAKTHGKRVSNHKL